MCKISIFHIITLTESVPIIMFQSPDIFQSCLHLYQAQLGIFMIMCTVVYKYMNYNAQLYNHWMPIQLLVDNISNIESRCHQKLCLQIKSMPLIPRVLLNKSVARYATAYWLKDILRGSHRLNQVCLMATCTRNLQLALGVTLKSSHNKKTK